MLVPSQENSVLDILKGSGVSHPLKGHSIFYQCLSVSVAESYGNIQ